MIYLDDLLISMNMTEHQIGISETKLLRDYVLIFSVFEQAS